MFVSQTVDLFSKNIEWEKRIFCIIRSSKIVWEGGKEFKKRYETNMYVHKIGSTNALMLKRKHTIEKQQKILNRNFIYGNYNFFNDVKEYEDKLQSTNLDTCKEEKKMREEFLIWSEFPSNSEQCFKPVFHECDKAVNKTLEIMSHLLQSAT